MHYGSVCSGIEAASVAWHSLGWKAAFLSEIEAFPRAVLAHHYPSTPLHGDFTTIQAGDYEPIDLLVGGTPCQSFSVAGLRGGLADERGNLALEFLKLADRLKPRHLVWENVPGVLSSENGDDFTSFLDGLEEIGYVADIDILDAQFFGLAQRRRRVFVCAERAESILTARTLSSGLTLAQCLIEISLLCLIALSDLSIPERESLAFDASKPSRSLQRRMRLFGLDLKTDERVSMLAASLDAIQAWSGCEPSVSALVDGSVNSKTSAAIRSSASRASESWRGVCLNTELSWSGPLADLLQTANECITSTVPSATIASKIYSCAWTTLRITALITQSMHSCPSFWSAASSASIAMKAFTNYARSTSSDLFTGVEWLYPWRDFLAQAEPASQSLGDLRDEPYAGTLLPISKSLRWDSPPRREAGEGITGTLSARASAGGGLGTDFECGGGVVARCLNAHPNRSDGESETFITVDCSPAFRAKANDSHRADSMAYVAHSLRAESFDASEDGTGRGTPLVVCEPIPLLEVGKRTGASTTDFRAGSGFGEAGDPMFTLQAGAQHGVALAFDPAQITSATNQTTVKPGQPASTLNGSGDMHVATRAAVRRLTPRECARLQGFPDTYLDITFRGRPAADGPKYRALGNSMAVPCMAWIGRRIAAQEAEIHAQRQQAAA